MTSIILQQPLACTVNAAWALLSDVDYPHRAFPDVLVSSAPTPGGRTAVFANGSVVQELIIGVDHERRRLAYAVQGSFTHHSAAMQIVEIEGQTVFVWSSDFLPDDKAPMVKALMQQGAASFAKTVKDPPPSHPYTPLTSPRESANPRG